MKLTFLLYPFLALLSCNHPTNKITISKVSPYLTYTVFNSSDTNQSKCYDFTLIKNNVDDKLVFDSLFKFIKTHYKSDFDTIRPVLLFKFWKYEKGIYDENFVDQQTDRSISTGGTLLYEFRWDDRMFYYAQMRDNDGKYNGKWFDSLGNEMKKSENRLEIKEAKNNQ